MVSGLLLRCSSCGNSAGDSSGNGDVNSFSCVDIQMIMIILQSDHSNHIAIDITIMKSETPGPLPSSTFQTASKYCKHESQHLKSFDENTKFLAFLDLYRKRKICHASLQSKRSDTGRLLAIILIYMFETELKMY